MTWEQLERTLASRSAKAVETAALKFNIDIVKAWPVDTGRSRSAWTLQRVSSTKFVVSNNVNYSQFLWWGMPLGSPQMPAGGDPILKKVQLGLYRDLKRIAK